jgi:hypothetical protein
MTAPSQSDRKQKGVMMSEEKIIAFCGLICSDCPAYLSKLTDNDELRKKTAKEWSTPEWNLEIEDINCDGCTSGGELAKFCALCEVWKCGSQKGITSCAFCGEYPCENLEMPWSQSPQAKEILDDIRKTL